MDMIRIIMFFVNIVLQSGLISASYSLLYAVLWQYLFLVLSSGNLFQHCWFLYLNRLILMNVIFITFEVFCSAGMIFIPKMGTGAELQCTAVVLLAVLTRVWMLLVCQISCVLHPVQNHSIAHSPWAVN